MDCIGLLGYFGIFVLVALAGFTVMCVPLFYTVVTRWAFSGGRPVTEFPPELRGGGEGEAPAGQPAGGEAPDGAGRKA